MNRAEKETLKMVIQTRLESIRSQLKEGHIDQTEASKQIASLLGLAIEKNEGNEEIKEFTTYFTCEEVIIAFGLEEQHN